MNEISKKHFNKIKKQNKRNPLLGYFLGGGSEETNKQAEQILKNLKKEGVSK